MATIRRVAAFDGVGEMIQRSFGAKNGLQAMTWPGIQPAVTISVARRAAKMPEKQAAVVRFASLSATLWGLSYGAMRFVL